MTSEAVAAIFTAIGVVIAACIARIPQLPGWRDDIKDDLNILYRLIPLTDSVSDWIILERYRKFIFSHVNSGFDPPSRMGVIVAIAVWVASFLLSLLVDHLLGIPITPITIATTIPAMIVGWLLGLGLEKILENHPKTNLNPIYRMKKEANELREQVKKENQELESQIRDIGLISNYDAYLLWRRHSWGTPLPKKDKGKDGDTADRENGGNQDVTAHEAHDESIQ